MKCSMIAASLLAMATAVPSLAQTIDSLEESTLPRAGRVIIHGSGFGNSAGQVLIDGVSAPVSFWSSSKIRAYVPDAVALGSAEVRVEAGGLSNPVSLEVLDRPGADGRIQWRFKADEQFIMSQPAVGPDGTVYVTGVNGHLYALTPTGGIKWIRNAAGNRPPSVDATGNVYVTGGAGMVTKYSDDGETLWEWVQPGNCYVGPNVGPDGNIYGVTDARDHPDGPGAFVLSPDGEVLFTHHDNYDIRATPNAWEVGFTDTQWFVTSGMGIPNGEALFGIFAFDLGGGGPNWTRGGIGTTYGGAGGDVYLNDNFGNRIVSYRANGSTKWSRTLNDLGGQPAPGSKGPDDTYYIPIQARRIHALNPEDGSTRWEVPGWFTWPSPRPDGSLVAVYESQPFGLPQLIRGFDAQTGETMWTVPLDVLDSGLGFTPQWFGDYSNDADMLYIGSAGPSNDDSYCYIYAIDARLERERCDADLDGDGDADADDFFFFLDAFASGDPTLCDMDGDGDCDADDFFAYLDIFAVGC